MGHAHSRPGMLALTAMTFGGLAVTRRMAMFRAQGAADGREPRHRLLDRRCSC